ncbi:DUF72 domain-containing protein [Stutzerimonas tarimensis]|uniref:DUF72 domain-containing protein n=1 Tax=Stutzerimonas tarimensis TaxID=1507735 RepID=A0ABV7T073_9GAMM
MTLPYYLGCPSWNESHWLGSLYPPGTPAADFLACYASVFNTVEGNTTFYAWPSTETLQRWAGAMPDHFRFCAKFPRDISHAADLGEVEEQAERFEASLAPLGARAAPLWLQLPAGFGPSRLAELECFIRRRQRPVAVEVRHPVFFAKGDEERRLNRLLRDRSVERICLDSRALFSCTSVDPAVVHAQSWKPRLPTRPTAFSDSPQLRFIGHPELRANDGFLHPWLDHVAAWIERGLKPHVYLHTPDNWRAPELAFRFHRLLQQRLPGLPPLSPVASQPQLSLLDR